MIIDASSIDTGVASRDAHLRAADFLDVRRYPEITFRTLQIITLQEDRFRMVGELSVKERVSEVTLEVEASGVTRDPWGNERAGFSAMAILDRRDFGLDGTLVLDSAGVVIGKRIEVEIDVEAVKQSTAPHPKQTIRSPWVGRHEVSVQGRRG